MLQNHAFEQTADNLLLFGIELRHGFELEAEFIIGAAFIFAEQQLVRGNAQRHRQFSDHVESGLRGTAFVSFWLLHMRLDTVRELLLRETAFPAQSSQTLRKVDK